MDDSIVPRARGIRVLPFVAIVGICMFWGAATVGSFSTTGYHPLDDVISEMSARDANRAGLMIGGYLMLAIATGVLARVVAREPAPVGGSSQVARLLRFAAIGSVGAAVFRCDAGCPSVFSGTFGNFLHGLFSMIFFSTVLAAMVIAARGLRASRTEPVLLVITVLGLVVAVPMMLLTALLLPDHDLVGLTQRLFLLAETGWMTVIALRLS